MKIDKKFRNDLILVFSILFLTLLALIILKLNEKEGAYAVVTLGGEEIGRYSLSEDVEVRIDTGNGYNIFVVDGGKAYIREADCPDGRCSRQTPITHVGRAIACSPHNLVVTVEGEENEPDVDAVS